MFKILKEKVRNDKLKTITVFVSIIVFIVSIVVTAVNTGDTYAISTSDFGCLNTTYEVVTDNGSFYCCPKGWYYSPAYHQCFSQSVGGYPEKCKEYGATHMLNSVDQYYFCRKDYDPVVHKYTITYNANGGTGGSASESKLEGVNIVLSGTIPTREGYTFYGWNTKADGTGTSYNAMGLYTANANVTLYAQWIKNKEPSLTYYTITYNANGGTGAPASQDVESGLSITIPTAEPHKTGYSFEGWARYTNLEQPVYSSGQTFTPTGSMILYAVWQKDYLPMYSGNGSSVSCYASTSTSSDISHTFDGCSSDAIYVDDTGSDWYYNPWKDCYIEKEKLSDSMSGSCLIKPDMSSSEIMYSGNVSSVPCYSTPNIMVNFPSDIKNQLYGCARIRVNITNSSDWYYSTTYGCYVKSSYFSDTLSSSCSNSGGSGDNTGGSEPIQYNIEYKLNGGTVTGNPTTGTYDEILTINKPEKTIMVVGNVNGTDSEVSEINPINVKFKGWTSNNIDKTSAYYGDTAWTDYNTFVTDTSFKNLASTDDATVTLEANWEDIDVTLPTVTKEGYTCTWNTKDDGTGSSYSSGGKYTIKGNEGNVNVYAICENNKINEEIKDPEDIGTGDALIIVVWIVGVGALGYSAYYFMKRKSNI